MSAQPHIGQQVLFYDEDKQPHAAIVAHVFPDFSKHVERPICNLAIFKRDGRVANRVQVEPAYDNGERWVLINKWAFPEEVPDGEWDYLPEPVFRIRKVGAGEHIPTT